MGVKPGARAKRPPPGVWAGVARLARFWTYGAAHRQGTLVARLRQRTVSLMAKLARPRRTLSDAQCCGHDTRLPHSLAAGYSALSSNIRCRLVFYTPRTSSNP